MVGFWDRNGAALWLALGSACVVEVPPEDLGPCDRVECSIDGYCEAGECFCRRGWLGDPYALHGCQPAPSNSACETTCGLNAYCESGACVCAQGFVAVCGTGDCIDEARVCDDFEDCQNGADEDPAACEPVLLQSWRLTDGCDDGQDVRWRLWAEQRDWVWPTIDTVFVTGGLDRGHEEVIECIEGERICFGATSGDLSWGIGADGDRSCEDCCFACDGYAVDVGTLGCP